MKAFVSFLGGLLVGTCVGYCLNHMLHGRRGHDAGAGLRHPGHPANDGRGDAGPPSQTDSEVVVSAMTGSAHVG